MRIEKDLLGEREVPADVYYGIHTLRALENFPLSGYKVAAVLVKAIALIKKSAAEVNAELGYLPKELAQAIGTAANEIMDGKWQDQFVVDALQGGAGTSTNMNVNEVLANRAIEILGGSRGDYQLVHPLNHVNMHQSTNDVYPTALRIAAIWLLKPLSDECAALQQALQDKEADFAGIIKVGRTEMQDAVPIMLGQEFSAYAGAIARDRWRLYKVEERLRQAALGGTAIGTGLNADKKYIYMVNDRVRQYAGVGLARAENMIDVIQNADVFVEVSGLLKALAVNLGKIAHDLRLMSSGPRAGLGEIRLPERQAGSSIMPGKVNPIIPEAVNQVAFHVMASDMAIAMAAQSGQLELNAFMPLIAHHLLESLSLLTNAVKILHEFCIRGVTANCEQCTALLNNSQVSVTALVPHIGYDLASQVARKAMEENTTVREAAIRLAVLPEEKIDAALDPRAMTHPGIAGKPK
ncbi:aspartate ammonia-lyase [Sporomusa acidovorans]|uniref:Aspartate ammonia-lyase n=1 Tax=Sporomusa acidovorans (strain ATCC 49682 / DSM 3132 / Mol) TaxID=1123286 RepID=A0ABZ3JB58_SPOA4|nr:aspartate ammonia-lyase [Sporomusa acidovorans]OZC22667.1 aspartate ammonia-lyase [Sporomusa acidovorans DSM 3132]SDE77402.1 aspartate ammonia-lyase [Sporomusa acidovorans]